VNSTDLRYVVFHDLNQATAALLAANQSTSPVSLCTARGAVRYAGPAYLLNVVRLAVDKTASDPRVVRDALIDCRGEPALAFASLRIGWRAVIFSGAKALQREVSAAADEFGATLVASAPRALDLLDQGDPMDACLNWYAR